MHPIREIEIHSDKELYGGYPASQVCGVIVVKPKKKKCSICKTPFLQYTSLHKCCSWKCALKQAVIDRKKKEKRERKERKEKSKTLTEYLNDAQKEFNAFIRERDKGKPCISCGTKQAFQWQAGHYRTTKAAPQLRFNEENVHRQCSSCNNYLSGNLIKFREGLINRIGMLRVELLERNNERAGYTITDAKMIRATYKEKRKELQK